HARGDRGKRGDAAVGGVGPAARPAAGRALAARDRGNDADGLALAERRLEPLTIAGVDSVHVDVDERPQLAPLVKEQIRYRQRAQGVADRPRADLEPVLPACFGGEQRGENYDRHSAVSIE